MGEQIGGNTKGLKAAQLSALTRTFRRRVPAEQLVTIELCRHLCAISIEIGRQVGVLINRQGVIEQTFVGLPERIYLPEIGRHRGGRGKFRGLRHLHTVIGDAALASEDLADLTKLRLDGVLVVGASSNGTPGKMLLGCIEANAGAPSTAKKIGHKVFEYQSPSHADFDFASFIRERERDFGRALGTQTGSGDKNRAVLVGVYPDRKTSVWRLAEMQELAGTAGVSLVDTVVQIRRRDDHRFVVGSGKLEEVVLRALDTDAELLVFDANLSPAQARGVAAFTDLKVIDRTQLILDIFAQHASSHDGKLQVELAQLRYNLPRLTDMDAGLSRLTGGIGGRGPGETKLEINRRRARERISKLEREIERLSKRRGLRRQARQSSGMPIVSIVGYTNAGKSTLLNALTHSHVDVADQLFATLDPTTRRLRFPRDAEAIITDTVGFIRDLPSELLKAFRATMEELEGADLLLHIVDVSDPMREAKIETVRELLRDLFLAEIPELLVYNKCDLLERVEWAALCRRDDAFAVSATSRDGLPELIQEIYRRLPFRRAGELPDNTEVQGVAV